MINSTEARAQTIAAIETQYAVEITDIGNRIDTASKAGEYSIELEPEELPDPLQLYIVQEKGYVLTSKYKTIPKPREEGGEGVIRDAYVELSWKEHYY